MLGTRCGSDFSDTTDPIFSDFRDPMIIISDSRDLIFNSRDRIESLKRLKKTLSILYNAALTVWQNC